MAFKLTPPTLNQIITLMIALVIIGFVVKMLPEQYRTYFRV